MNGAKIERHDYEGNFTQIPNDCLRDESLSLKAKGLLAVIYSLAKIDSWNFTIGGLLTRCKENETAIYSAINELKERGYCWTEKIRSEDGSKIGGLIYHFDAISNPDWIEKNKTLKTKSQ